MSKTNNAQNVSVGKPKVGGAVWVAPTGTTLPTDASTALDQAFKNMGYISEDGLKKSIEKSSEDIKAWGGDVVASPQSEFSDSFSAKFIEALNVELLKTIYGSENVTGSLETGITVKVNSKENEQMAMVVDMIATGNVDYRIVIPFAKITELEETEYVDGSPIGYGTKIKAFPDSTGNNHYEYIAKNGTVGE